MDTRSKIIDPAHAAVIVDQLRRDGARLRIVTGYFDVLLAGHVRRLCEIADGSGKLFVAVLDPPRPVLDARARAELVAALAVVDYVVPADKEAALDLLSHFTAGEIVQEESADLERARQLTEHVQRRHQQ
jgi:bifunctional ADP-heptose synthase (sugar kinase/adenylyltransferase)